MPTYCTLVAVAVATAGSVWTRRYTLPSNFDRPITLSLIMQCLALWLMAPFSEGYVGTVLHAITGRWNVGDLIGDIFLIVAVITSFMGVAFRLAEENEVRAMVFQRVVPAAEVAIALMLMFFWQSSWPKSAHPVPSLLMVPFGGEIWMRAYFVVLIAVVGYIGHMALRILITLYRVAPGARSTIIMYVAAYALGALALAVQLGTMFVPAVRPLNPGGALVWTLMCACVILSAIGSAWSWRRTLAPFRPLIKATGARL